MKLQLSKPCFRNIDFKKDGTGWYQYISQYFYQNASSIYKDSGKLGHGAIDIRTPIGTPIYAMHDGKVLEATQDNASSLPNNPTGTNGLYIRLVTDKKYDYKDTTSYYWTTYVHLSEFKVRKGDKVVRGQLIGISGNTGYSSGPHTHCGLAPVYKSWVWNYYYKQELLNGFHGYINILPFMTNMFERIQVIGKRDQYIVYGDKKIETIPDVLTLRHLIDRKIVAPLKEELTEEQFNALNYQHIGKFPSVLLMSTFEKIASDILLAE